MGTYLNPSYLDGKLTEELLAMYPALSVSNELPTILSHAVELTGNKVLKGYGGELVLVGISYDEKTKKHTCKIERSGQGNI